MEAVTWSLGKTVLQLRCSKCAHILATTFEECPKEEELPCPKKGCGGSIRTRPAKPESKKKTVRKKRAEKEL